MSTRTAERAVAGTTPPSRKRPAKRARPPNSYVAWPCITLNVDPGEACGVSIFRKGAYVDSGHGDGYDVEFIDRWIENAVFYATASALPLVLVLEKPPRGGMPFEGRNPAGPASVMGCRKLWLRRWRANKHVTTSRHTDVYPVEWRGATLGITTGPMLERAEFWRAAQLRGHVLLSRDEAASVVIGEWSARAGVVGALIRGFRRKVRH